MLQLLWLLLVPAHRRHCLPKLTAAGDGKNSPIEESHNLHGRIMNWYSTQWICSQLTSLFGPVSISWRPRCTSNPLFSHCLNECNQPSFLHVVRFYLYHHRVVIFTIHNTYMLEYTNTSITYAAYIHTYLAKIESLFAIGSQSPYLLLYLLLILSGLLPSSSGEQWAFVGEHFDLMIITRYQ